MVLVLSNVFIAILCDAYSEVQDELKEAASQVEGVNFFQHFSKANVNKDSNVDADELKAMCKVNDEVANKMLKEYGGGDGLLNREEYETMRKDFEDLIKD